LLCLTLERNYTAYKNVLNHVALHPQLTTTRANVRRPPPILCGLPRTGTTLLYNLLAYDPACRAPLLAEMTEPIPVLARFDSSGQMRRNQIVSADNDTLYELGLVDYQREVNASYPSFVFDEDQTILAHAGLNWLCYILAPSKDSE
jgi:hypothetical protein